LFFKFLTLFSLLQLRDEVSKLFQQPSERLCLVYGGKIMKDDDTIKSYGVKNQHSVHLVIRNPPGAQASSTSVGGAQQSAANVAAGSVGGMFCQSVLMGDCFNKG
jgi:ubiquilin